MALELVIDMLTSHDLQLTFQGISYHCPALAAQDAPLLHSEAAAGLQAAEAGMQPHFMPSIPLTQPPFALLIPCSSHFTDKETEAERGCLSRSNS